MTGYSAPRCTSASAACRKGNRERVQHLFIIPCRRNGAQQQHLQITEEHHDRDFPDRGHVQRGLQGRDATSALWHGLFSRRRRTFSRTSLSKFLSAATLRQMQPSLSHSVFTLYAALGTAETTTSEMARHSSRVNGQGRTTCRGW